MTETLPEPIKAALRNEGLSAAAWKRLRDAWRGLVPMALRDECVAALAEARKIACTGVEVNTLPTPCRTVKEATIAVYVAALSEGTDLKDVAARLGIGKTTLYRNLHAFGLEHLMARGPQAELLRLRRRVAELERKLGQADTEARNG